MAAILASGGWYCRPLGPMKTRRGCKVVSRDVGGACSRVRALLGAGLFTLAVVLVPCAVMARLGVGDVSSESTAQDPFFKEELDNSTYDEEKAFLEMKEKTGEKTLFGLKPSFYYYASDSPPEAQLELARIQLQGLGEPTDVVDRAAKKLAELSENYAVINDGGSDVTTEENTPEEEWVNVAGTGSVWNIDSYRKTCPEVRRHAFVRIPGISRVFRIPSPIYQSIGLSSMAKKDYAVISNDVLSNDESKVEEERAPPLGTVLQMPAHCFVRAIWRDKYNEMLPMAVNVVKQDEKTGKYVETGEKLRAFVAVDSTDERFKWKMGYFRFREILEQRAHDPQRPLQEFVDDEVQQKIKDTCLDQVKKENKGEVDKSWTLRRCFFEMERDALFGILGHQLWDARWGKPLGLSSYWKKGTKVFPNAVYLRVVLCGAKKVSNAIVKELVENSFLWDNKTTVKEWLLSGDGSLDIPDGKVIPETYAMARDCTAEELMEVIKDDGKEAKSEMVDDGKAAKSEMMDDGKAAKTE